MITRRAFNAGEIMPELHYRDDLAQYQAACRIAKNYIPMPQGSMRRRPGTISLQHDTITTTDTIFASIPWTVSNAESWLLLIAGGAADSTIYIFPTDSLYNTPTTLTAPWSGAEVKNLNIYQINDVMLICHPAHQTKEIRRTTSGWQLQSATIQGGPWMDQNTERGHILALTKRTWLTATDYEVGDIVSIGSTQSLTGTASNAWYNTETTYDEGSFETTYYYHTRITLTDASGVTVGDTISISNSVALDGDWTVAAVNVANNTIDLATGTSHYINTAGASIWTNNFSGSSLTGASITTAPAGNLLWKALTDNNSKPPLTSPDDWGPAAGIHGINPLTSTLDLFTASDVGRLVRIRYDNAVRQHDTWADTTAEGTASLPLPAHGTVTLRTDGIWDGTIVLQKSINGGGSWQDMGLVQSVAGRYNGVITYDVEDFTALIRVVLRERNTAPSDSGLTYHLEVSGEQWAVATISEVTDARTAIVFIDNFLPDWPTSWAWQLGAFSNATGYPACCCIYEERLSLAGVPARPTAIYRSRTNDFTDFQPGTFATSPDTLVLPDPMNNAIRWMLAKDSLLIGTTGGEWTLGNRTQDIPKAQEWTHVGSADIQAIATKDVILFAEKGGRTLQALRWTYEIEGYDTDNMSLLAGHLTADSPIAEIAYSRDITPVVWILLEDGSLLAYVYDRSQGVNAFARMDFGDDKILSMCLTPTQTSTDDLWLFMERDGEISIEKLAAGQKCLDMAVNFDAIPSANEVFPFISLGEHKGYDNDWTEIDVHPEQYNYLLNLKTAIAPFDLIFKTSDGSLLKPGTDYLQLDCGLFLVHKPFYSVWNLDTELQDYFDYDPWVGSQMIITKIADGIDLNTLTFEDGATVHTEGEVWWKQANGYMIHQPDDRQTNPITGSWYDNGTLLDSSQAKVIKHNQLISPHLAPDPTALHIGIPVESVLAPTDMSALPQAGRAKTSRISHIEVGVVNSIGGEVSADDGESWELILDQDDEDIGQGLQPFTGTHRIPTNSGSTEDGALVQIRNTTPHEMTVALVGIKATRT